MGDVISFKTRKLEPPHSAKDRPDIEGVFLCGDIELRPDVWVQFHGLPLDLTVGELTVLKSSIAHAVVEYGEDNGYV